MENKFFSVKNIFTHIASTIVGLFCIITGLRFIVKQLNNPISFGWNYLTIAPIVLVCFGLISLFAQDKLIDILQRTLSRVVDKLLPDSNNNQ